MVKEIIGYKNNIYEIGGKKFMKRVPIHDDWFEQEEDKQTKEEEE